MNTQAPSLSVSAPGRSHSRCQVHQERYNQENRRYIHTSLGCFLFVLNNEHQSAAKQWQYSRHSGRGRPSARTPHPLPWPAGSAVSTGVLRADVTILAVFNRGLGQEVANEVDSLCKAGRQRRELIPCFWPAMNHKGPPPGPPEPQVFRLRDAFSAALRGLRGPGSALSSLLQLCLSSPESDSETLSMAQLPRDCCHTCCNPQDSRMGLATVSSPASRSTGLSVRNGKRGKEPSSSDTPSFEGNNLLGALHGLQRRGVWQPQQRDRSSEGVPDTWGVCSLSRQKVWGSQLGRVWCRWDTSSAHLLQRQVLCLLPGAPPSPL